MPSRKPSLTAEQARTKIADKLRKAGDKGVTGFVTAKTSSEQQALYAEVLGEMLASASVARISGGPKPKYFAREFAPNAARAGAKIEQYAALKHPLLLAPAGLKKALSPVEKPFLAEAIQRLQSDLRLIRLRYGKAFVYAHADSLRAVLGTAISHVAPASATPEPPLLHPASVTGLDPRKVREGYRSLVGRTGFPDVEIAALHREAGGTLSDFKAWLLAELHAGRADLYLGDWSLADEATRAAAIEAGGERYLLVRLKN